MLFSEFFDEVQAIVGDIPLPTVIRTARKVAIHFCIETRLYTQTQTGVSFSGRTVALDAIPADTKICGVNSLKINDTPYAFVFSEGQQAVLFSEDPPTNYSLADVELVLRPSRIATSCDDALLETYYESILAGILANVLALPNKAWSNVALSLQYAAAYQEAIEDGKRREKGDDNPIIWVTSYGGY